MSNPAYTPLGKKVDLGREVQGTIAPGLGAVVAGRNLGTTIDGLPVLQGMDPQSELVFYRLQPGEGVTLSPSTDGNAILITSSVLAGNTPGIMLQSVYDPTATGIVQRAAAVPWTGITGLPPTFPPTLPLSESDITNLVADLASKVPITRMLNTAFSLEGGGPLSGDLTISLIGDRASVGPEMRYGTDASGVLGWYAAATGVGDMAKIVYDRNNNGIVDSTESVEAGGVTTVSLADGAVTGVKIAAGTISSSALAPTAVTGSLGYVPVNKTGDTMTGQLAVLMNGPNTNPNMYQNAHLFAEVAANGTGYPTIGLARLATGGGAVAIWFNSGHGDLQLEYGDGTTGHLLSSISSISGAQLAAGSVPAGALASGVAQANLGYRPVNAAGDSMVNPGVFVFQREVGLGSSSWQGAPIRVQCATSGARAQIAFWNMPTNAVSLFLDPSNRLGIIDAGGNLGYLGDSFHKIDNSYLAAGVAQANLGYAPVNRAGDTMTGALTLSNAMLHLNNTVGGLPGIFFYSSTSFGTVEFFINSDGTPWVNINGNYRKIVLQ